MNRRVFHRLGFAVLFLVGSALAEDVPIMIQAGLFDMDAGDMRGLPMASGAETITIYRAGDDTYKFANHPQLVFFKGRYFATWQATPRDEDSDDSVAVYSVSDDGLSWSPPRMIAEVLPGERYHASGGWWTDGDILVCYILRMDRNVPGEKTTFVRTSTDGDHWSDFQLLLPDAAVSAGPQQLPNGRLILAGHGKSSDGQAHIGKIYFSDQADGLGGWRRAELPELGPRNVWVSPDGQERRIAGRALEHSLFVRADGRLTMIFRDTHFNSSERTFRSLASISEDRGETWTRPVITEMPDSESMQCCGNLPDGTAYMVNCPSPGFRRVPLAITLSDDGITFDRAYVIQGTPPKRRYQGKSKTPGYSYPHAMVHNGYLWVSAAVNKEDIQVTRIPLQSLRRSGAASEANASD